MVFHIYNIHIQDIYILVVYKTFVLCTFTRKGFGWVENMSIFVYKFGRKTKYNNTPDFIFVN